MKIQKQKIKKLNSNGTKAIVIPKTDTEAWCIGDEVNLEIIGQDFMLIDKSSMEAKFQTVEEIFNNLETMIEAEKDLLKTLHDIVETSKTRYTVNDEVIRDMIKTALLTFIKKV